MSARSLTLALVVALALPAAAHGQVSRDSAGVDINIPDSIGVFHLIARKNYESAAEGFMLRYQRADGLTGDVFLYPGPDLARNCDLACAQRVLKEEGDGFAALIPEMIKRGYVESMEVVLDEPLSPPDGAPWRLGRHMAMKIRRKGADQSSDMYLYYLPVFRVKVRATYAPDAQASAAIAELAAAVPAALAANSTRTSAPPTPATP